MRTIISIGEDDKPKESFYFPILDDKDPEMEEIHGFNRKLRSQQPKKNNGPLFFDFSNDEDDEEITKKLSAVSIGNKGIIISFLYQFLHVVLTLFSTQQ